jgi:catechol 2,3-dioxygenase-like lactoylglutathione lyase family enzyme
MDVRRRERVSDGVGVWHNLGMSMPARLSVVTVGARDLPRLRLFYSGLGWKEVNGSDNDWSGYHVGGVLLALYPLEALAQEAGAHDADWADADATDRTGWSGMTLACNVDSADEVDSAFDAAIRAGGTAVAAPTTREWGGRSGYFADPEGNRWEIAWAPSARFDDLGGLRSFG